MHRLLSTPDVLIPIFQCIFNEEYADDSETATSTLAGLARTYRDFTGIALDILWRNQLTPFALLQVMPEGLWSVSDGVYRHGEFVEELRLEFERPLEETDWERFDFYSKRILCLGFVQPYSGAGYRIIDDSVFMALSAFRPIRTFFPNLREIKLDINFESSRNIPMIQCFLGATLRSVVIKFDEEESYMAHLFSSITRLCPELEDFQIQSVLEEPSLAYTAALSNLVSGLPKLRVLAITSWQPSEELVAHLGSLPTLEEWAYFELPEYANIPRLFAIHQGFQCLRHLSVSLGSCEAATDLVRTLESSPLVTLRISYPHPERLRSLDAFVNALLTHPSAKSLSTLAITETPMPDVTTNHHNAESVAFFLFRKFFKLPAIESLELTVPILSSLDDSWLEEASSAWPRLSTLELRGEGPPMMTLQGLVPLLKNCAHLEHLRVSAVWKPFDTTGLRNCSNFKIQEMRIGNLVVAKPVVAVFRCLLLLFPVINEVVNQAPGASEDRRWMRLKTLIEESRGTNTGDEEDGGGEATD